jgi:hypothetical protein
MPTVVFYRIAYVLVFVISFACCGKGQRRIGRNCARLTFRAASKR